MTQERASIPNIKKARETVLGLGAIFIGDYVFCDKIFVDKNNFPLSRFLRLRIYSKNNWPGKNIVLLEATPKSAGQINIFSKQEFENEQEANELIKKNFPDFKYSFEYSRIGWQYNFKKAKIFIEDTKGIGPSVEVESGSEDEIKFLLIKLGAGEKIESVFQTIRNSKRAPLTR